MTRKSGKNAKGGALLSPFAPLVSRRETDKDFHPSKSEVWGTVRERIRKARVLAGYLPEEVCTALQYKAMNMVSKFEHGKTAIPIEKLIEMAELYGTTLDFLFGVSHDPASDPVVKMNGVINGRMLSFFKDVTTALYTADYAILANMPPVNAHVEEIYRHASELNVALAKFSKLNPEFAEDMRGSGTVQRKVEEIGEAVGRMKGAMDRHHAAMEVRFKGASQKAVDKLQMSLLEGENHE